MIMHNAQNLSSWEVKLNAMSTNVQLIIFTRYIFEASTLCLALLGNIILKDQMYYLLTEVTIGIRELEVVHLGCL